MSGDIWTFLHDTGERVFRFWVYRRMFTPHEIEEQYIDESVYEDTMASLGIIKECVVLPDDDVLLGFQHIYDEGNVVFSDYIAYFKLSEIRLEYWPDDQELLEEHHDKSE